MIEVSRKAVFEQQARGLGVDIELVNSAIEKLSTLQHTAIEKLSKWRRAAQPNIEDVDHIQHMQHISRTQETPVHKRGQVRRGRQKRRPETLPPAVSLCTDSTATQAQEYTTETHLRHVRQAQDSTPVTGECALP